MISSSVQLFDGTGKTAEAGDIADSILLRRVSFSRLVFDRPSLLYLPHSILQALTYLTASFL